MAPPSGDATMAAFATLQDFEARHGIVPAAETPRVEALLDDASAFIREELSGSDDEWLDPEVDPPPAPPAVVKAVCVQVAYRAWSNPDGVAREQIGEVSVTFRGDDQSDAMWLTKNEVRMLRKAANGTAIRSIPLETPYSGPRPEYDLAPGHGEGI